jgi:hypothetical protein
MGCGCGGNKRNTGSRIRPASQPSSIRPAVQRQVQNQSVSRQNLVQQARDKSNQNISSLGVDKNESERKRRIQISLRNRNLKRPQ